MKFMLMVMLTGLFFVNGTAQPKTERVEQVITTTMLKSNGTGLQYLSEPFAPAITPDPFYAVSLQWKSDAPDEHAVLMRVRGSVDGESWSDWLDVGVDHHTQLSEGWTAGNLVFLPVGTRYLQYQADAGEEAALNHAFPQHIALLIIAPGATTDGEQREIDAKRPVVQESSPKAKALHFDVNTSAYDLPAYVPRTVWGSSLGLSNTANRTQINPTHLFVHHSATSNTSSDWAAVVRSFYVHHTQNNGWSDIGYNWLVDRNGVLYQGRAFSVNVQNGQPFMDVQGAHAGFVNSRSLGVCVIGDFTNVLPTSQAILQLRNVLAWKANDKKMDVLSRSFISTTNFHIISGHKDAGSTSCPGDSFYPTLPNIRNRVNAFLNPPDIYALAALNDNQQPASVTFRGYIENFRATTVAYFEYDTSPDFSNPVETPDIDVPGSAEPQIVTTEVSDLSAGTVYYYRLIAVNSDTFTVSQPASYEAGTPTSAGQSSEVPGELTLLQNYPNPFNPATTLTWIQPENGWVKLTVTDLLGREIEVLVNEVRTAGTHRIPFNAASLSSGIYLYRIESSQATITRRMLLIK